jgi:hypothetical protein
MHTRGYTPRLRNGFIPAPGGATRPGGTGGVMSYMVSLTPYFNERMECFLCIFAWLRTKRKAGKTPALSMCWKLLVSSPASGDRA